jgi:glycosyltransferase involved in cell wall biosynthesis
MAESSGRDRLRVLHIIQNLNYGGMERLLADLVLRIDPDRFESHVIVLQYFGRFAEGLRSRATLRHVHSVSGLSMIRPVALTREIRDLSPDVVHCHSGVWFKASLAARRAGVPRVVYTEHGRQSPDPWLACFIDGMASRRTHVAVAVSQSVADALESRVVRGRCRVEIILNGVDTDLFAPIEDTRVLRQELGLTAEAPILGSIGRLEPIKGFGMMIDAFAMLLKRARVPSKPYLVIAGDGSDRERLQKSIEEKGLGDRIRLLGWRDEVRDVLSAFSLFTMSSYSEGTSVSLLEAMSSGLCPVVTDVGGNPDVLGAALEHRLVPSGDPAALAREWERALTDAAGRERDGLLARSRVKERFSLRAMVEEYERVYSIRGE